MTRRMCETPTSGVQSFLSVETQISPVFSLTLGCQILVMKVPAEWVSLLERQENEWRTLWRRGRVVRSKPKAQLEVASWGKKEVSAARVGSLRELRWAAWTEVSTLIPAPPITSRSRGEAPLPPFSSSHRSRRPPQHQSQGPQRDQSPLYPFPPTTRCCPLSQWHLVSRLKPHPRTEFPAGLPPTPGRLAYRHLLHRPQTFPSRAALLLEGVVEGRRTPRADAVGTRARATVRGGRSGARQGRGKRAANHAGGALMRGEQGSG